MERMYFFDSTTEDQRIYQAADWARFHAQIIGNGVSNTPNLPDLEVTAKTNMDVALGSGYMFANGYMYENDSTMTLNHAIADPNNDRIDRIIVCFDNNPAERTVFAYIKKGIPGAIPKAPSIIRDSYVYEMSVAQVRIIAGKSFIEQGEIKDERTDDTVCGYIPLHNIYRGLDINEFGMVTMPNQSFMKSMNHDPVQLTDKHLRVPFGTIETDKQGEVINNTTFKAKSSGVYQFWVEFGWTQAAGLAGVDIQIYLYVNGEESFPLAAQVFSDASDNFVIQSGFDELAVGDEVSLSAVAFRSENLPATKFIRFRVAKTS